MECNWNKTWTRHDSLDECKWVACLYPPEPPIETRLSSTWDNNPIEFFDNNTYVCPGDDLFFEWDREMEVFNISCLPGRDGCRISLIQREHLIKPLTINN